MIKFQKNMEKSQNKLATSLVQNLWQLHNQRWAPVLDQTVRSIDSCMKRDQKVFFVQILESNAWDEVQSDVEMRSDALNQWRKGNRDYGLCCSTTVIYLCSEIFRLGSDTILGSIDPYIDNRKREEEEEEVILWMSVLPKDGSRLVFIYTSLVSIYNDDDIFTSYD